MSSLIMRPSLHQARFADVSEIKMDFHLENGPIPVQFLRMHLRHGLFKRMEISMAIAYADFTEQGEQRFSEIFLRTKFKVFRLAKQQFYTYLKFRAAPGEPIVAEFTEIDGVNRVVSPYADKGEDFSVGFLGRNEKSFRRYAYTFGLEYTLAQNRDFEDFVEDQKIYSAFFSLQTLFFRQSLMLAIENKYSMWVGRGDYLETLPQVRWEFVPDWVLEAGVLVQVVGSGANRIIVGVTYEF